MIGIKMINLTEKVRIIIFKQSKSLFIRNHKFAWDIKVRVRWEVGYQFRETGLLGEMGVYSQVRDLVRNDIWDQLKDRL